MKLSNSWKCLQRNGKTTKLPQLAWNGSLKTRFLSDASARGIYKSKNKFPSKKVRERESQVQRAVIRSQQQHTTQLKCKLLGGEKEIEKWMGRAKAKTKWVSDIWRAEKLFTFATIKHLASARKFSPRRYLIVAAFSIADRANTRSHKRSLPGCFTAGKHFSIIISRLQQRTRWTLYFSIRNCQRNWRKIALWCLAVQRDSNLNLLDKNKSSTRYWRILFSRHVWRSKKMFFIFLYKY